MSIRRALYLYLVGAIVMGIGIIAFLPRGISDEMAGVIGIVVGCAYVLAFEALLFWKGLTHD